jgi:hypothetical protein
MTQHTVESLKAHINTMDMFSQVAFTRIRAAARLALHALETPSGVNDLQSLGYALQAIADDAATGMNDINCEAERAGGHFCDDVARRRLSVQCQAQRSIEEKAVARALDGGR